MCHVAAEGKRLNSVMGNVKPGLASRHGNACKFVFSDGHTSTVDSTTPLKTLEALATRAGGEAIGGDDW
jgi:hypothetical protein